jgi:hypothetical protein
MATVIEDLLDGHGARLTTDGYEFDRIAIVTGLTGDGHSRVCNAINDAGMPDIGDAHPAVATCLLRSIEFMEMGLDMVKLRLHYAQKDPTSQSGFTDDSIQSGASVIQEQTNKDINGEEIVLNYTYPATYQRSPHEEEIGEETEAPPQNPFVGKLVPQYTKSIQKLRDYDPDSEAMTYVGKINSSTWKSGAAKTWMCTGIVGDSVDGGENYRVTYSFQYNPRTWVGEVVFIRDDGKAPTDRDENSERSIDLGNPIELYETANFDSLGL